MVKFSATHVYSTDVNLLFLHSLTQRESLIRFCISHFLYFTNFIPQNYDHDPEVMKKYSKAKYKENSENISMIFLFYKHYDLQNIANIKFSPALNELQYD